MASEWEQIVRRNATQVVNAALRVLGNAADAEDVAQEVFVEAFQRWRADDEHNWAGLLRRTAVCRALDFLRRRRPSEPFVDAAVESSTLGPAAIAIGREVDVERFVIGPDGLGPVAWGMTADEVIKHLGKPDGVKPFGSSMKARINGREVFGQGRSGEELIYDSHGFRIVVAHGVGVQSIDCYGPGLLGRAKPFAGTTNKGLRMGATSADVVRNYGEPDRKGGPLGGLNASDMIYRTQGLQFYFRNDRLSQVHVLGPNLRPGEDGVLRIRVEPPAAE